MMITFDKKKHALRTVKYNNLIVQSKGHCSLILKGLCQLESMRSEVMRITFNCQNSIVFNA